MSHNIHVLRRWADQQHSGHASMERSVLREVLLTHIHDLNETVSDVFKPASKELAEAFRVHVGLPFLTSALLVSATADRCRTDDVVSLSEPVALAKVLFHVRYEEHHLTYARLFNKVGPNRFRPSGDEIFAQTECMLGAVIYKKLSTDEILVSPQSFYPKCLNE